MGKRSRFRVFQVREHQLFKNKHVITEQPVLGDSNQVLCDPSSLYMVADYSDQTVYFKVT